MALNVHLQLPGNHRFNLLHEILQLARVIDNQWLRSGWLNISLNLGRPPTSEGKERGEKRCCLKREAKAATIIITGTFHVSMQPLTPTELDVVVCDSTSYVSSSLV